MGKPQGPCRNCTERSQGCHSRCGRYKEYREKLMAYNRIVYSAQAADAYGGRPWMKKNSKAQKEFKKEAERDRKR